MAAEWSVREDGSWLLTDDGEEDDPADEWLPLFCFHPVLHPAIEKTSRSSMNFVTYFPPDRPWASDFFLQLFFHAITGTTNHLDLLLIADEVQRCRCIDKENRDNLLLNIRNRL